MSQKKPLRKVLTNSVNVTNTTVTVVHQTSMSTIITDKKTPIISVPNVKLHKRKSSENIESVGEIIDLTSSPDVKKQKTGVIDLTSM